MKKKMFTLWMTGLFLLLTTLGATAQNSGTTGPLNWNYDAGTKTLTITGTGDMPDFNPPADRPWDSFRNRIQTVTIGAGVTTIGEYAFHGCTNLPSITIPNSVTAIGEHAFGNCWTLTSITLPDGLQTIGEAAFSACAMTSITLPESLTTIEKNVFWSCDKLTSITIPNRVTTIGESAFYGCKKLPSITIPNGVTTIGKEAFYQCNTLTSVTIPKSMTTIGVGAFASCWALKSITLPNGVTTIENNTFYDCPSLTSITLPNRVTAIGRSAFAGCVALKSITLPESLTTIGKNVFWNCWTLKSITFPNSVTTIGESAFHGCTGLKDVTVDWKDAGTIPNIPANVFDGITQANVKLHVPHGTVAAYQLEDVWKDFQIIEAVPPTPTLSVTPKTLSFIDAGETKTITVNASAAWTAQCDASWITLSATSGTGNGTITVTAPAYEDEQPRTAKIIFASGALKETVTVTQNPKPGPAFVALDYTELTLPAGASQRLVVTAYPKDADINRNVKWYSSNNDIATVSRDGTVTALAPGRANITVVANVGGQQTACRVRVVPAEQMVSVTSGGDNTLRLALVAPSDADFTLSFDVDLPEGFALDAKKTAPDASLAAGYAVTVTGKRVEMKPNGLRSGGTMEKRNLLTFACTAAPGTSKGSYKAALRNFTFTPTAGYALQNITVPFTFTHTVANQTIDGLRVYAADGALRLTLPTPETVHIYNVVGSLVRTMNASAGDHVLPLSSGMYVVRLGERVTKILIK
ncbi:leucine-rich repeat protein [Tannerella forsythia]|uniref:Bacterial Ig-like domain (Group 2) n=1 Tax=Tannerella forsythia TaxID=28112 RepID=A0A1D3UI90_TANFO|nr:leucine-rich repeat protein [Tannerella forsythia]SCQ19835.1 Bacterial Ig-like domain (group 2) [Tannerella forsythia]